MNIATLGVAIDPGPAKTGAAAATQAFDQVTAAATRTSQAAATANQKIGQTSATVGQQSKAAARDHEGAFGGMIATVRRYLLIISAATTAFAVFAKGISAAAEMETATNNFAVLLKSVDAAKERMQELTRFAADTPFEIPEVVTASRQLEIFTKGALSTGAGLTMVGDAATVANVRFDEMGLTVGRAYAALMNGSPVGEAMESLRRFGVVGVETSNRLLDMQKQGLKGSEVWKVLENDLLRFSGAMKIGSASWAGMMSNLRDKIGTAFRAFGEPILDQLKPLLGGWIAGMNSFEGLARTVGQVVANTIATMRGLFEGGTMGEAFALTMQIGTMEAVNFLTKALGAALATVPQYLLSSAKVFLNALQILATKEFWSGMAKQIFAIAADFGTRLIEVFATPIAIMQAKLEGVMIKLMNQWNDLFGGDQIQFDEAAAIQGYKNTIVAFTGANKEAIKQLYAEAKTDLSGLFEQHAALVADEFVKIAETAKQMFAEMGTFFDQAQIDEATKKLDALLEKAKELGTFKPENITPLLPKAGPQDGGDLGAGESGDKFKSKMESDLEIMREYRREAQALKDLRGPLNPGNAEEFGRRKDQLTDRTVGQLADPKKYADELGKWRTFQAEKELVARETDARIEAGGASMMDSLGRGFQKASQSFGNLQQTMVKGAEGITNAISNGVGNAMGDIVTGAKSAKDAFRDMAIDILNGIAKMITQLLVELAIRTAIKAISGYANGGPVPSGGSVQGYNYNVQTGYSKFADGGAVWGGRGGIDDIPAYLTAGEFVIPKDAADYYGRAHLEDIRNKRADRARGFADGGMVGVSGRGGKNDGGAGGIQIEINVDAKSSGGDKKDDKDKGDKLGQKLRSAVLAVIVEEKRAGGLLAGATNR